MVHLSAVLFVAICGAITSPTFAAAAESDKEFNWDSIKPTKDLVYHNCYGGDFKCARLAVPLNWQNKSDSRTAAIAIRTLPATVSVNDPSFAGSVLTNPGGPGESGVNFAGVFAFPLQTLIDKPGRRHYEIVSFDPRGAGRTTPQSNCFSDAQHRDIWGIEYRGAGGFTGVGHGSLSRGSMAFMLAMNEAFASHCIETEAKFGQAMAYVNTPSVARDMVEIVDRIHDLYHRGNGTGSNGITPSENIPAGNEDSINGNGKLPRIQYMGFSYGTFLGNTFASLFPGRVGRMVLDGILDANDYATGGGWLDNTVDTNEILDKFWEGCIKAGPTLCPLAGQQGSSSASDAQARFWSWIKSLNEAPNVFPGPTGNNIFLTGDDILGVVAGAFYAPIPGFQTLAASLSRAMSGNKTELLNLALMNGGAPEAQDVCGNSSKKLNIGNTEVGSAVLCGDGDDVSKKSVSWWLSYAQKQEDQSRILGRAWTLTRLICSSWPIKASWSFKGPFKSPKPDPSLKPGIPAAPILFLSSRLDPVTPLRAARKMAANHPGARVVIQESIGHCTLPTAPSNCTRSILADYMDTGIVPAKETVCQTSCGPWDVNCHIFELPGGGKRRRDAGSDESWFNPNDGALRKRRFPVGLV